jgi:hypothetical protein
MPHSGAVRTAAALEFLEQEDLDELVERAEIGPVKPTFESFSRGCSPAGHHRPARSVGIGRCTATAAHPAI